MNIEAEIKSLEDVFTNKKVRYSIPEYQRPYSWSEDNLKDLISDLITAYEDDKELDYFVGSVVLVAKETKDSNKHWDVIDGQQRLTTFSLLFAVIQEAYGNTLAEDESLAEIIENLEVALKPKYGKGDYRLTLEAEDLSKLYKAVIDQGSKATKANRYLANYKALGRLLEEEVKAVCQTGDEARYVLNFALWIFNNVKLAVVECPNEDVAIQIFNVLNDRGLPLSPLDILKARFMKGVAEGKRKDFHYQWSKLIDACDQDNIDFIDVVTSFTYYKIGDKPAQRFDRSLLKDYENSKKGVDEYFGELQEFCAAYIQAVTAQDAETYCFRYLRHKIYWTTILATATYLDYPEIETLKKRLVAYYYQNWIAGATVARIKGTSIAILKMVSEKQNVYDIQRRLDENLKKYNTAETCEEVLNGAVYGYGWDKAVLFMLEYNSTDQNPLSFIALDNKTHIEHILPQEKTNKWAFSNEEHDEWVDALANLTLLSGRKNSQASNLSFAEKKNVYGKRDGKMTSFPLTRQVAEYNDWTVTELEQRHDDLQKRLEDLLRL